jgi:hypothetical protein
MPAREIAISIAVALCCAMPSGGYAAHPAQDTSGPLLILPGVSPYLIGAGQWELVGFSSFSWLRINSLIDSDQTLKQRASVQTLQMMFGLDAGRRLNVGFEAQMGSVYQADTGGDFFRYAGLSVLGMRLRANPFATLPELTLQSALLLPAASDRELRGALGRDRTQWLSQANFYQQLRPWLFVFLQLDAAIQFRNAEHRQTTYAFPASLYAVAECIPGKLYLFPGLNYSANYEPRYKGAWRQNSRLFALSLGAQWIFSPQVMFNVQLQRPLLSDIESLVFDIDNDSYALLNFGLRFTNAR